MKWNVFVFLVVLGWNVWNKIVGVDPETIIGTTVGCSLGYLGRTWYGISGGCN